MNSCSTVVLVFIGLACIGCDGTDEVGEERPLVAAISSPKLDEHGFLAANPSSNIDVTWNVSNEGDCPVADVTAAVDCRCQIRDPLPITLQPGERAQITIRISTPPIGTVTSVLPLLSHGKPVGELRAPLAVKSSVPQWVYRPKVVILSTVEQSTNEMDTRLEAIELREAEPWLAKAKVVPPDFVNARLTHTEEPFGDDPVYCKRVYRLLSTANTHLPRECTGHIILLDGEDQQIGDSIRCELRVAPRLSVLPDSIVLSTEDASPVNVVAVVRGAAADVHAIAFDASCVSVDYDKHPGDAVHVFTVRPAAKGVAGTTLVEFGINDSPFRAKLRVTVDAANTSK